ncbi:hypothetical protein QQP08_022691 [Theobroma cacao]|uniref:Uncharacterized protein n=1 Tax=Theobroma cacao TaxID=3641 RepID=A0A061FE66_THECC|nr:Uncharacterized protein TCM_034322 [Theobroma cacao]WRX30204.1 hypothetical protein QQP08_022691 [Theobroma cacao]
MGYEIVMLSTERQRPYNHRSKPTRRQAGLTSALHLLSAMAVTDKADKETKGLHFVGVESGSCSYEKYPAMQESKEEGPTNWAEFQ